MITAAEYKTGGSFALQIPDFDIRKIMDSGQCFRITPNGGNTFTVLSSGRLARLKQENGGTQLLISCSEEDLHRYWWNYFDLSTDYAVILASIDPKDQYLSQAASYGRGIRILRQDLWETIISFLISQNNNIPRIRKSIEALCGRFGKPLEEGYHAFPTPDAIAQAGPDALQGLGLGYRDKYILAMAKRCAGPDGKEWLRSLEQADCREAMSLLTQEYGVGIKVAGCICLFALHHVDAFPIDTHIRQILEKHYPEGFPFDHYQGYSGIIQQYLFYYDLAQK